MKTIFISIYDGDTERVILRTGVFETLKQSGHKFVLLIRGADRISYYEKEFGSEHIKIETLPAIKSRVEELWFSIGWNTIPTRSSAVRRYRDYYIKKKYWLYFFGGFLSFLGRFRLWRQFLRFIYLTNEKGYALELFEKYEPSLLFAANMFSPEDTRLLATAKKLKIPSITIAKSWDVLTTKAFTRVIADKILVYNEYNKKEAIELGDYKPEQVIVTGFPQFDIYNNKNVFISREEFCKKNGLEPECQIILYGLPGDWKSPDTRAILLELSKRIEMNEFVKPIQILARFHPKYKDSSEGINAAHIVFDCPGTYFSGGSEFSIDVGSASNTNKWTFRDDDIIHLANSLFHSDIVINVDSTLTLDAAALDKPSILIGYDGDRKLPYKRSVLFIYERNHYQNVMRTGATPIARNHEELVREINAFLLNPGYLIKERKELKDKLLYKTDGKSGERMGSAVLELLNKN